MYVSDRTETIGFKQCHVCQAELLERDNYCRRCGVNQNSRVVPSTRIGNDGGIPETSSTDYSTRPLAGGVAGGISGGVAGVASGEALCRAVSGPMVVVVTQELSERTSSLRANRWAMRLVGVLVAAPLWLMIVLLSPLDAYVAVKTIAKQG